MATKLRKDNIDDEISRYLKKVKEIPVNNHPKEIFQYLDYLKRQKVGFGPYHNVTFFESANRIMTDLTILYGIKDLLKGAIPEIAYQAFEVELGNDKGNAHDILAGGGKLKGEAFNVAKSFFQTKKSYELKKLREKPEPNVQILLLYNSDAVKPTYKPKPRPNEYHWRVHVDLEVISKM